MTQAQNSFENGLMMDMNPINTPASVLTNCLNGTFLTFNGNEYILQNDMGNGKVETARLPDGYVPVGCTAFGGILYIVSQNPKTNQCQIGCFPSPERNLEETEDFKCNNTISSSDFIENGVVKHKYVRLKLSTISLNPGDKFYITASNLEENKDCLTDYGTYEGVIGVNPKYVRLRVATLDSNNQLIYIDNNLTNKNNYYIGTEDSINTIDELQTLDNNRYDIFDSKINGDLYLVAQLEIIDTFSYTYSVDYKNGQYNLQLKFYWSSNNWNENRDINPSAIEVTVGNKTETIEIDKTEIQKEEEFNSYEYIINNIRPASDNILSLTMSPYMDYGLVKNLVIEDTIDFDLLGTGEITINNWQYYVSSDTITLRFEQDTYPEKGKNFTSMSIYFYTIKSYYDYCNPNSKNVISFIENADKVYSYTLGGRSSYSGIFNLQIDTNELPLDQFYLVVLSYSYGTETKYKYKTLYSCNIFNDYYISNAYDDFTKIKLTPELLQANINANSSISSNINVTTNAGDIGTNLLTGIGESSNTWGTTNYQVIGNIGINQDISFVSSIFSTDKIRVTPEINKSSISYGTYIENGEEKEVENSIKKSFFNSTCEILGNINNDNYQFCINSSIGIYSNQQTKRYISYKGRLIPLLYTEEDLEKYMLSFEKNHFIFDQFLTFSGRGWNDIATVDTNGLYSISAYSIFQSGYSASGSNKKTYSQFNKSSHWGNALSVGLNDYFADYTVIPFIFTKQAHQENGDIDGADGKAELIHVWWNNQNDRSRKRVVYYGDNNKRLKVDDGYIYEKGSAPDKGDTLATLNTDVKNGIIPFGLLIKSTNGTYLMSNTFGIMSHASEIPQRLGLTKYSVGDIFAQLLMQLYRYDSEEASIEQYAPELVTYLENVTETFTIELKTEKQLSRSDIKVDGIDLQELISCIQNDSLISDLSCNLEFDDKLTPTTTSNTFTLNTENQLVDTYLGESSNNVYIVKNKGEKASFTISDKSNFSTTGLYILDNDTPVAISSLQSNPHLIYSNCKTIQAFSNFNVFKSISKNSEGVFYGTTTNEELYPQGIKCLQYRDGLVINQNNYRLNGDLQEVELQVYNDNSDYNYVQNVSMNISLSKMFTTYELS